MAVLIDENTRLLVQGLTGREGSFHAKQAAAFGTTVVGGVTPGKGGTTHEGWRIFDTVDHAVRETGANASVIFVPPAMAGDAIMEAADTGLPLVVCISEGIPTLDMMRALAFLDAKPTRLIGPNCPGVISPGKSKAGIIPGHICREGRIGIVSKSGTLTYEAIHQLTLLGLGQTTCVGIGGDPLIGTSFVDVLRLFAADEGDRGGCADRRDRGDGGGRGGPVHPGRIQQAGGGFHCRPNRSTRPSDGACGRDHHRGQRDGGGENGCAHQRGCASGQECG